MKIHALIVDDEAPARARLRHSLRDEADFEVIGECANGREAIEAIRRDKPDLVFLDIQMPRLTGFDVCAQLNDADVPLPFIIFCTAYDQYALKAFEVHAIDYLLKPFDRERFKLALAQARNQLRRARPRPADHRLAGLLNDLRADVKQNDRLVFKQDGRVILVRANAIDWLEADGNYVRIHCGSESHYVRETLASLEKRVEEMASPANGAPVTGSIGRQKLVGLGTQVPPAATGVPSPDREEKLPCSQFGSGALKKALLPLRILQPS